MPVVHLNEEMTNITAFVNSMFDEDVRTIAPIQSAIEADQRVAFFSPSDSARIIAVWHSVWMGTPDPRCPPSDAAMLGWLQQQLRDGALCLHRPLLSAGDLSAQPPHYVLTGYAPPVPLFDASGKPLAEAAEELLTLLLAGAHVVAVQDAAHLPAGAPTGNLYDAFRSSGLEIRKDPANSHYLTGLAPWNTRGRYYLSITEDAAPVPCPFLCALLFGPTVSDLSSQDRDTFLQLEGWQEGDLVLGIPSPFGWHNRDYNGLYEPTLWNISTYGACAYSEKRGSAVFLAPASWQPRPQPETIMAPYAGSDTPEEQSRWLDRSVVSLRSS